MDSVQVRLLAVVQGLTEFLPISSSAHLILVPVLLGWEDQGLAFDVAVHLGSLAAVATYFRRDIVQLFRAWLQQVVRGEASHESRLAWGIIIATLPICVLGVLLKSPVELYLRSPWVIGLSTLGFGLLLGWVALRPAGGRELTQVTLRDALIIGFAQVLALIPGTSRAGITLTAGCALGLSYQAAARFSFLLSIPTILAASLLATKDLLEQAGPVDWSTLGWGFVLSALSAYACIHVFLQLLQRIGLMPFVIYRVVLGCGLLLLLSFGVL